MLFPMNIGVIRKQPLWKYENRWNFGNSDPESMTGILEKSCLDYDHHREDGGFFVEKFLVRK